MHVAQSYPVVLVGNDVVSIYNAGQSYYRKRSVSFRLDIWHQCNNWSVYIFVKSSTVYGFYTRETSYQQDMKLRTR